MKVIITESQLNKILNETKWVGKSVGVKGIMNNIMRYMNDTAKKTLKQTINKMGDGGTSIAHKLDSNRQKIADIMTKQGFTDEKLNDVEIYKNAAEKVYNNDDTQSFINNIIDEIIKFLSKTEYVMLKGSWMFQSENSIKKDISKTIQKIAHMDMFKIQNPEGNRYSHILNKTYIDSQQNDESVFDDTILVDSIYDTINELL